MPGPARDVAIAAAGIPSALPPALIRRAVGTVLDGERAGDAAVSVTFLSSQRMRALNRRTFGRDRATDVIAFGMPHGERLVADVYVCPPVARRAARHHRLPEQQELLRLVVHGLLHALGHDHPETEDRTAAPMWIAQERYVRTIQEDGA